MAQKLETEDVECAQCQQVTHHDVLAKHSERGMVEDWYQWMAVYRILKCRGCDAVTLASEESNSEDFDREGNYQVYVNLYPPRGGGLHIPEPSLQAPVLPVNLWRVYRETLTALNNEAPTLAAVGLRSIVEGICSDQKVTGRNLGVRIDGLVKAGILPTAHAAILHKHRVIGNKAAHELQPPTSRDLDTLLQIVEQLLRTTYVVPHLALQLSSESSESPTEPLF